MKGETLMQIGGLIFDSGIYLLLIGSIFEIRNLNKRFGILNNKLNEVEHEVLNLKTLQEKSNKYESTGDYLLVNQLKKDKTLENNSVVKDDVLQVKY
jgi:hypothetical protein